MAALAILALVSGCAGLQQDLPAAALYSAAPTGSDLAAGSPPGEWPATDWWSRYGDPELSDLIERALRDAPGMRAVAARTQQAQAGAERVRAATGLNVSGAVKANRQWSKTTGDVDGEGVTIDLPVSLPGIDGMSASGSSTSLLGGLAGVYRFDLWGDKQAAVDAAMGAARAQRAEAAAVRLALSTAIAQNWFKIRATQRKITLLERMLEIQRDSVAAAEARERRGLVTDTAVAPTQAQVLASEQLLAAARAQLAMTHAVLRALAASDADIEMPLTPASAAPPGLPADLPYALLSRRPDLVALRWAAQASLEQITIAKAAFYPQLDLTAFIGVAGIRLSDLQLTRRQFNLIPGLTLPIFNLDLLNAGLQSARSASNALVEQYNQAVLDAVRDVAVAATGLQAAAEQLRLEHEKVATARIPAAEAQARHQRGLISRVQARLAQLPVLQEELLLADADGSAVAAQIALIAALGGGYPGESASPVKGSVAPAAAQAALHSASRSPTQPNRK